MHIYIYIYIIFLVLVMIVLIVWENLYVQAEKIRATERNEKVTCEFCGNEYQIKNKARHCKSAKHLKGK